MSRPTVREVDFHAFKSALERSTATGARIVPAEKGRWATYVASRNIRESNFQGYARSKYESLEPVIIDDPGEWGGYYMWSQAEEVAFRWERPAEAAGAA